MQVLLIKDVDQLGVAGDIKNVSAGYARNFLFPRDLATQATPGAIKKAAVQRESDVKRVAKEFSEAQALARQLDGLVVTFQAKAGEADRLYGSITNANIAEALEEQVGQQVDRRKFDMDEPLKELGTHAVTIRLAAEAEAKVTVVIEREEESQES